MKSNFIDRAIEFVAPRTALSRQAARQHLEKFRFDGARSNNQRRQATSQTDYRNNSQYERDRVQLMRNARDLEENYPIVGCINTKYALNVAPCSYQAQTGDKSLDRDVEDCWKELIVPNCDLLGRYDYYELANYAVSGTKRDGDHGWILVRDGSEPTMSESDRLKIPLQIKAIESDMLGNPNIVTPTDDYISGIWITPNGKPVAYEIWKRLIASAQYVKDMDVDAVNFIHFMDNLRVIDYRGYSCLAAGENTLRDLKETLDALRMAVKKHASITAIFTNSLGAEVGPGEFDPFKSTSDNGRATYYENTEPGKNIYTNTGEDVRFPESGTPSNATQALLDILEKQISMCYNLPVSFSVDATKLGGVSIRLESMQALAEFKRARLRFGRRYTCAKNALLLDAVARKELKISKDPMRVTKGSWGYVEHPTPDIGKEASALKTRIELNQADPMQELMNQGLDPETTAVNIARWQKIKQEAAQTEGVDFNQAFTPAKPSELADMQTAEAKQEEVAKPEKPTKLKKKTKRTQFYDEDQPRDDDGQWADAGGGSEDFPEHNENSMKEYSKDFNKSLSKEDLKGINGYISNPDSFEINKALRTGGNLENRTQEETVSNLENMLNRQSFPYNATAYRAMSGAKSDEIFNKLSASIGSEFKDEGFISTTLNRYQAEGWGEKFAPDQNSKQWVLFEMQIPKGAKAAYMGKIGRKQSEQELLLQKGSKFKVISTGKRKDGAKTIKLRLL